MVTSREVVYQTLEFKNTTRVPRQMWALPWADIYHHDKLVKIRKDFPTDFKNVDAHLKTQPKSVGNPYEVGEYTDIWGAKFKNIQRGIIGEVKEPIILGDNWETQDEAHIPYELLGIDKKKINEQCAKTDKFIIAGECPRPFEQLQFLRGTVQLYMDLAAKPQGMIKFMEKMHSFYCEWVEAWAQTDVDGIMMMDDWGSQNSLLISPKMWEDIFKPMYKDYIDIAKKYGKKTFMHSDGNTIEIIPHLIELGLDAFNTQIFCIGIEKLKQFKGKITFWGEIDRQHILVDNTQEQVAQAVKSVYENLWDSGGCIAQCEFGAGANPDNVYTVFETWDALL